MMDIFRSEISGEAGPLQIKDLDSAEICDPLTTGWIYSETSREELGRVVEIHVIDRPGIAWERANYFEFGGIIYEKQGPGPNPAVKNVMEWVWVTRPVGTSEG